MNDSFLNSTLARKKSSNFFYFPQNYECPERASLFSLVTSLTGVHYIIMFWECGQPHVLLLPTQSQVMRHATVITKNIF